MGCLLAFIIGFSGCSPKAEFRSNAVHRRVIEKSMLPDNGRLSSEHVQQIDDLIVAMFGTPDEPWFPDFLTDDDPELLVIDVPQLA